ncbi:MAG: carbohydrate ABC transporter permease [Clostridia bacterium]|nr:carbohydrate ABC transporter permease [Clostridia bacterium]
MENTTIQSNNRSETVKKVTHIATYTIIYILLIGGSLMMFFPYLWMVMTSLKTNPEAANTLQLTLFPKVFQWKNYVEVWQKVDILIGLKNTVLIEISVIPVGTFVTAMAAFSFAKLKLIGKNFFLLLLMSGMMVPYAALLLPQYRVFSSLNMIDTLWPLILPGFFGNISMMFFFVQYMRGIPSSLFEAAKIDGAGYFAQYVRIMLPLLGPALAAQIVFWFVGIWNDYFAPSVYLSVNEEMTLQVILGKLNSSIGTGNNLPLVMAGAVLSSLPLYIIYICFQRFFIESMAITGIKG